jgi:hypothetical protein
MEHVSLAKKNIWLLAFVKKILMSWIAKKFHILVKNFVEKNYNADFIFAKANAISDNAIVAQKHLRCKKHVLVVNIQYKC